MEKSKKVELEEGKHFTLTALASYLNDEEAEKESKTPYTAMDIQKYLSRGHMPAYLGGYALSEMKNAKIGLKLVVIGKPVAIKKGKKTTK